MWHGFNFRFFPAKCSRFGFKTTIKQTETTYSFNNTVCDWLKQDNSQPKKKKFLCISSAIFCAPWSERWINNQFNIIDENDITSVSSVTKIYWITREKSLESRISGSIYATANVKTHDKSRTELFGTFTVLTHAHWDFGWQRSCVPNAEQN